MDYQLTESQVLRRATAFLKASVNVLESITSKQLQWDHASRTDFRIANIQIKRAEELLDSINTGERRQ